MHDQFTVTRSTSADEGAWRFPPFSLLRKRWNDRRFYSGPINRHHRAVKMTNVELQRATKNDQYRGIVSLDS